MKKILPISEQPVWFTESGGKAYACWVSNGLNYARINDQSWEFLNDDPQALSYDVELSPNCLAVSEGRPYICYKYNDSLYYVTHNDYEWADPVEVDTLGSGNIESWAATIYSSTLYVAYVQDGNLKITNWSTSDSVAVDQSNDYRLLLKPLDTDIYCVWVKKTVSGSEIQHVLFDASGGSFGSVSTVANTSTTGEILEFDFNGYR